MTPLPRILCIGGHDPTGGAGIQADIETVAALGGRAITLVTALTAQDTYDIQALHPTSAAVFAHQAEVLLSDIRPDAIKIGLIGSPALVPVLRDLLRDFHRPVVLDPVLAAGGGFDLDDGELARAIVEQLLPRVTLLTPNRAEARRLGGQADADAAATDLLHKGAQAVLLTAADEAAGDQVVNRLYSAGRPVIDAAWPRLDGQFHGSGCTLASACATGLALGHPLPEAARQAQAFTWRALQQATPIGGGQWLPGRLS